MRCATMEVALPTAEVVAWRGAFSGEVTWVPRRSCLREELLEVAFALNTPQALLIPVLGARCYVVRQDFPGLPGLFPAYSGLAGRHCEVCDDLVVAPSPVRSLTCGLCARLICRACEAMPLIEDGAELFEGHRQCLCCWAEWENMAPILASFRVQEHPPQAPRGLTRRAMKVLVLRERLYTRLENQGRIVRPSDTLLGFPYSLREEAIRRSGRRAVSV